MDLQLIDRIKRLTIIALVSDDSLMERLFLKGGNAIDLIHGVSHRASMDIDFSLAGDFAADERATLEERLRQLLETTFGEQGLRVFDVRFVPKPREVSADLADFWGGYGLEFKVAASSAFHKGDLARSRREAIALDARQRRTFFVDFSRFEHCEPSERHQLDGFTVRVYAPVLIIAEKLRAICQQTASYCAQVRSPSASPRPRDFVDIVMVADHFGLRLSHEGHADLVRRVFEAKRVRMVLLGQIGESREFHRTEFKAVLDTIRPNVRMRDFDHYFDRVLRMIEPLQPLWIVEPPPR